MRRVASGGFGVQTDGLSMHSASVVIAFKVFGLRKHGGDSLVFVFAEA
jgi:hypothetical protein